jgi:nucleoside-diphosphate-sugar epimerase
MSHRQAFVTGGTGFIGRHLVRRLVDDGCKVTALVRPGTALPAHWSGRVATIAVADWTPATLAQCLPDSGFDIVYHLAAYGVRPGDREIADMLAINARLPATLVELVAARGAALVAAGSCAEYAEAAAGIALDEAAPLETEKLYGASKAAGGLLACAVAVALDVRYRYLRLFNVYGPGEAGHRLLPSLVTRLTRGERVPLSEGRQVRDFVLVDDVVDALVAAGRQAAARAGPKTAFWNVCTGKGHSVRDFASGIASALGAPAALLGFGDLAIREDEVPWQVGNGARIAAELGWQPRHDLAAGLVSAARRLVEVAEDSHAE